MKINFTKKEYRLLIDMIYISEWIMNSRDTGENEKTKPYSELEQKIYSHAKEYGFDNLITYSKSDGKYYPTGDFEFDEQILSFIDTFEEESFWETLCSRLAQRDIVRQFGEAKVKEMEPFERMTEEDKIAEKYDEEFCTNGLKNLFINET